MEALKFAFSFDKKLTRSGFICTWLAIVASLVVGAAIVSSLPEDVAGLGMVVLIGAYVWALVAMYIKRMNDMGWSGWYVIGLLIPFVNLFILGACLFTASKK